MFLQLRIISVHKCFARVVVIVVVIVVVVVCTERSERCFIIFFLKKLSCAETVGLKTGF